MGRNFPISEVWHYFECEIKDCEIGFYNFCCVFNCDNSGKSGIYVAYLGLAMMFDCQIKIFN